MDIKGILYNDPDVIFYCYFIINIKYMAEYSVINLKLPVTELNLVFFLFVHSKLRYNVFISASGFFVMDAFVVCVQSLQEFQAFWALTSHPFVMKVSIIQHFFFLELCNMF